MREKPRGLQRYWFDIFELQKPMPDFFFPQQEVTH